MFKEKIIKFFPTPDFLDVHLSGISISGSSVKVIDFEKNIHGRFTLKTFINKPLPDGVISDGIINDEVVLTEILSEIIKETGIKNVRANLPEEKGYLFEVTIPRVLPEEIRATLEFKIEENIPFSPDKVCFDYVVISDNSKDTLGVVVSALPIEIVDNYLNFFKKVGLNVYDLEIESQSSARAIIKDDDKKTYLILQVGKSKSAFYIVSKNIVHFTSTFNFSGEIDENIPSIANETSKVILYWQNNKTDHYSDKERIVQSIIVCGELDEKIISHLSSLLPISVKAPNVWVNVFDLEEEIPKIPFEESFAYASTVGLALPRPYLM